MALYRIALSVAWRMLSDARDRPADGGARLSVPRMRNNLPHCVLNRGWTILLEPVQQTAPKAERSPVGVAAAGFLVEGTSLSFATLLAIRPTTIPKRYPFPLRPIDESTLAKPRPTVPGASAYLHNPSQLARFGNRSLKCFYHQRLVVSFGALA